MTDDNTAPVRIEDGLTDQQRRGAELAAAGWSGVDIAEELGIRPETVSRWRKLPGWQAARQAIVDEQRGALTAALDDLAEDALAELRRLVKFPWDASIRLRAASEVVRHSGIGKGSARTTARDPDQRE